MKKLEELLLRACGYTVLILTLFYLFAVVGDFVEAAIAFSTFALIFAFGIIISVAGLVFEIPTMRLIWKSLIHYGVLLISFTVIFIVAGKLSAGGIPTVFSAFIIFTFLYAVVFTIVYFARKALLAADVRLERTKEKRKQKPAKKEYKALYKD